MVKIINDNMDIFDIYADNFLRYTTSTKKLKCIIIDIDCLSCIELW